MEFIIKNINTLFRWAGTVGFFVLILLIFRGVGPQTCLGNKCLCKSRGYGEQARTTCFNIIVFHGDTWKDTLMIWRHSTKPIVPK